MAKREKFFQMDVSGEKAEVVIYGDIVSWPWLEGEESTYTLSKRLESLGGDVREVTVRINSYGGEVKEGLGIFNALKAHPAKVTTVCDGMACSSASVVFMAGDERVMNEASLLMIHNAWSAAQGDANELRKEADALDAVTRPSKAVYLSATDLDEDELTGWMDAETWIDAATALERGFATRVEALSGDQKAQTARMALAKAMLARPEPPAQAEPEPEPGGGPEGGEEPGRGAQAPAFPDMRLRIAQAYMEMQDQ